MTVESATGAWTATFTSKNTAGVLVSQVGQGTVDSIGTLSGTLSNGTVYTGVVAGKTIKGSARNSSGSGPFSMSHP